MCFNNQKFTPKSFAFFLFGKKKEAGTPNPNFQRLPHEGTNAM